MASAPRTLRDLSDHPAVWAVDNETDTKDGYWVYLKPGYVWDGTTSHVHESTVKECCQAMADVRWDPVAWGHACGASEAEVNELLGDQSAPSVATLIENPPLTDGAIQPGIVVLGADGAQLMRFSDSYSLCGAAACLDAAGWQLSPSVAALSRRWANLGQRPNPSGVTLASMALRHCGA